MRVLILGHNGLLGNCVEKYFTAKEIEIITTDKRWPQPQFLDFIKAGNFDVIINCIATIPQSNKPDKDFYINNLGLPIYLASHGKTLIQPSSNLLNTQNAYSQSKFFSEEILENFNNVKIIRCSIIGIEKAGNKSLLSWFLSQSLPINGFVNHFWNGITTLQWAKLSFDIIEGKRDRKISIPYTDTVSKYELLNAFNRVFGKNILIKETVAPNDFFVSTERNIYCGNILTQLKEIKDFYYKNVI